MTANTGWLCPKCNAAHGPHIDTCPVVSVAPWLQPYPNYNTWRDQPLDLIGNMPINPWQQHPNNQLLYPFQKPNEFTCGVVDLSTKVSPTNG